MTHTDYQSYIDLLRCAVFGSSLEARPPWREIYPLSQRHNTPGALWHVAREREIAPKGRAMLEKDYLAAVALRLEQEAAREELFAALTERGIRHLPLKGQTMRALYPSPDLRQSTDVDFFYDKGREREVEELLLSLGYTKVGTSAHDVEYLRGRVLVEAHHYLTSSAPRAAAYFGDVWHRLVTEDGILHAFSDEDYYVYMMHHTHKHFALSGGVGVRAVLDIAVYLTQKPTLDRKQVEEALASLGILDFTLAMERLARGWFLGGEMNEDLHLLGDYVMDSGAFGTPEMRAALLATEHGGSAGKKQFFLRRMFPPLHVMQGTYRCLVRCPLLLPVMWVVRLFSALSPSRRAHMRRDMEYIREMPAEEVERFRRVRAVAGLNDL